MSDNRHLGTAISQSVWPQPDGAALSGQSVDLEPLSTSHLDALWTQASVHPASFDYLRYGPFTHKSALEALIADLSSRADQPFWAVIPKGGDAMGWASICDVYPADGSIEIGSIWFSSDLQGTRAGREALFLLMCHCMDTLGYERLVWRCHACNAASCRAVLTRAFTAEGVWRNAAVVKGWQRDIAWFSILSAEWPVRRAALAKWLEQDNFDRAGRNIVGLREIRLALAK